jgi:hypothetical protein
MTTYRVSAEFYIEADSSEAAEDALYDGLNSALKTVVEVSDVWGYENK